MKVACENNALTRLSRLLNARRAAQCLAQQPERSASHSASHSASRAASRAASHSARLLYSPQHSRRGSSGGRAHLYRADGAALHGHRHLELDRYPGDGYVQRGLELNLQPAALGIRARSLPTGPVFVSVFVAAASCSCRNPELVSARLSNRQTQQHRCLRMQARRRTWWSWVVMGGHEWSVLGSSVPMNTKKAE